MSWFRRKELAACPQNSDVATVQAKIAACNAEIEAAEVKLRRASLAAALGDDADAVETSRQVQALRSRKELLTLALGEAQRIEAERQDAARHREWLARKRSLAQKTGQLERDAAEVTDALKQLNKAVERFTSTGASILPLLPRQMQTDARPFHALLSAVLLRDFVKLEQRRQGDRSAKPERLGNFMQVEDPRTGQIKPLSEHIADLCANLKAQFEATGGLPLPTPAQNEQTPPPVLPVPTLASSAPEVADVPQPAPVASGCDGSEPDPTAREPESEDDRSGQAANEVANV